MEVIESKIKSLNDQLLEIIKKRRELDAFLLENKAFIITCSRKPGSTTKRYTSNEILRHSMNLTSIGMRLLKALRPVKGITPIKQKVAHEVRILRKLNFEFDGGKA